MKWTLFGYQRDAALEILGLMEKASRRWREEGERSSFALTATTGAGKTVIAAAVIEALFQGSEDFGFDADPRAVVLWLTDDESLNNQTMHNMVKAASLDMAQYVTIDELAEFPALLAARHLYFLNVQKLHDSSVRFTQPTDRRHYTLWDTLRATIQSRDLTLYLILDEAHKGMKPNEGRLTTVKRVVNGTTSVPAAPIVWGISATTERFTAAMKEAAGRTALPGYEIPIGEVQGSGLLKDVILLDSPTGAGQVDTAMLRSAVHELKEQSQRWHSYCSGQGIDDVVPLLVVQVENDPPKAELDRIVSTILAEWPELPSDAIANVFGDHKPLVHAGRKLRYILPESVQDDVAIRVLLAKDAVTTGWDCPRAEVLFSMRGAQDRTYITQFMGRMVRTPLARRIPSDEVLNTVLCLLPKFRRSTTKEIAERLRNSEYDNGAHGGERPLGSGQHGPKVYRQPVALHRNPALDPAVFDLLADLPSEAKPDPRARPIPRLLATAAALSGDGLVADAHQAALERMCHVLDGLVAEHHEAVEALKAQLKQVEISRVKVELGQAVRDEIVHTLPADVRTVDDAFATAARTLSKAVANAYELHCASKERKVGGELDLYGAKLTVAAVGLVPAVGDDLALAADKLVNDWLATYDVQIKGLPDAPMAVYRQIRMQSAKPVPQHTILPETRIEESVDTDLQPYPTRPLHLFCDDDGKFPIVGKPNSWEEDVLDVELRRGTCVAWYRNPSNATEAAIQVPYRVQGKWKSFQPDFIVVSRDTHGALSASVVDPHGLQFADALDKLRGMAEFASRHAGGYLRIESLAKSSSGQMVKLDMTDERVRQGVGSAERASDLFNGPLAMRFA